MITIHNFARGARGVRVAWLCEEMGLPYALKAYDFPVPAEYLAINPLGQVPFLQDDGGVAITESVAMLLYVAQRYGPTALMPAAGDPSFARVLQMTVFGEGSLGATINPLLMDRFGAPEGAKGGWLVDAQTQRLNGTVAYAATVLGDQPYFAGDGFTVADISVATAFAMWRGALGGVLPPTLAAYMDRVTARPAYQRAQTPSA